MGPQTFEYLLNMILPGIEKKLSFSTGIVYRITEVFQFP